MKNNIKINNQKKLEISKEKLEKIQIKHIEKGNLL